MKYSVNFRNGNVNVFASFYPQIFFLKIIFSEYMLKFIPKSINWKGTKNGNKCLKCFFIWSFFTTRSHSQAIFFIYTLFKVGHVIVAVLGEVSNLTHRDMPRILRRLYWSRFARYCMRVLIHSHTDAHSNATQMQKQVVWVITTDRVAPGRRLVEKMEVGWKRAGGKWTEVVHVFVCVCMRKRTIWIYIASFDVSGNSGSAARWNARGFLARIGCDFATNRSHRAVDFFRILGSAIAKETSYEILLQQ